MMMMMMLPTGIFTWHGDIPVTVIFYVPSIGLNLKPIYEALLGWLKSLAAGVPSLPWPWLTNQNAN